MGDFTRNLERVRRASTPELVAEELRRRILEGHISPGTQLSEESLGQALGVSRHTLREALRMLCHEKLAVHHPNRGVFVRAPTARDVEDLYRLRRILECGAIEHGPRSHGAAVEELARAVAGGEAAAAAADWLGVGTADMHFHQAIAKLADSGRIDELMKGILAETRLVFHAVADRRRLHEPFLRRNREILGLLQAGRRRLARLALGEYLDAAEQLVLQAFAPARAAERVKVF
ncbi:MAG: GntR family transcriptional regulator [Lautropia sp.]